MTAAPAPQPVELVPDGAGWLHQIRVLRDGTRECLVSWVDVVVSGYRGGLVDHTAEWLPEARVRRLPGTDYTAIEAAIEHVEAINEESVPARPTPPGWPPQVLQPDDPEWVSSATSWLLDILPPNYRAHSEIVTRPRVLAWMAATHVEHYQVVTQQGYRTVAVELRDREPPEAIKQVLDVYRSEKQRLATVREGIRAIRRALAAQSR